MKKILGNREVDDCKSKIIKLGITIYDLNRSIRALEHLIPILDLPDTPQEVIEALTTAAVISYARSFNKGFSFKLSEHIFDDSLSDEGSSENLSEREFHQAIMNYRNKQVGHSDKFMKEFDIGAQPNGTSFDIGHLSAVRALREHISFYIGIRNLAVKALQHAQDLANDENVKLRVLLETGRGRLSDEDATIVPIPVGTTPRKMWGLPERN